jgi:hypothetical protein
MSDFKIALSILVWACILGPVLYSVVKEIIVAVRRRFQVKRENDEWEGSLELLNRTFGGYPPDWQRRRALVFIRAGGRCQKCGFLIGRLACKPGKLRRYPIGTKLLHGADVHHVVEISRGGRHDLENLKLLCAHCHSSEHPENEHLKAQASRSRRWTNLRIGRVRS